MRNLNVRDGFFDFDPCPQILSDIDLLKLHYSIFDFPNPRINLAQTSPVVCSGRTMNILGILKLFEAISRAKIGFLNFGAKFKFCRIFTKIADISPLRSKSKNPSRTFKFRIYLLCVAKRRLLISEIQGPQSVAEILAI